jgi:L-arabinose isomerase
MDIQIGHLMDILAEVPLSDGRVQALCDKVRNTYNVTGLEDGDIARSARLGVALQELVKRYRLDGLVLLGQHLIEAQANAACYLGLSEILSSGQAIAVTEGDTIGCIISKVLKDFSGHTPFFGEWEEIDVSLNALMLLGHGFIDPREARADRPVNVQPACENWGFEGNSLGFEATYEPGPVTMAHAIHDTEGWRLLISKGKVPDTAPLPISESSLIVAVDKPVKDYFKQLMRYGFSHHCIVAPGDVTGHLECFARQLDMQVCWL